MSVYPTVKIPNPNKRQPLAQQVGIQKRKGRTAARFRVLERDNYTCLKCSQSFPETFLEVDHTIPLSQGGPDNDSNKQTLCLTCHKLKSDAEKEGRSLR